MLEPSTFQAPGRLIDFMRQADDPGLINLAAGVPGLEALPQPQLEEAFRRGFATDGPRMLAYHHPEGDAELRELLAGRLQVRGAKVNTREVLTVTGCTQGLQLMLTTLVQPGAIVACEAPAYYGMLELLATLQVRVLQLPVRGETGIDVDEARPLLERWQPRVLVVCSTLSNPSGATLPDSSRERLVEICRRTGTHILDDDIYADLLEGGAPPPLMAWDHDRTVVSYVSSYCKSVAPGLRVGVCIPTPAVREAVATLKCQQDLHSTVVAEVALREFFKMGAMEEHLERLRVRNRQRREIGIAAVEASFPAGTKLVHPRGGYMLWAELPGTLDFPALKERAHAAGIAFAAGTVFFPATPARSCVRLNCAKASEEQLRFGITKLGELITAALRAYRADQLVAAEV